MGDFKKVTKIILPLSDGYAEVTDSVISINTLSVCVTADAYLNSDETAWLYPSTSTEVVLFGSLDNINYYQLTSVDGSSSVDAYSDSKIFDTTKYAFIKYKTQYTDITQASATVIGYEKVPILASSVIGISDYALKATEDQRWLDSSQQRDNIRTSMDGYVKTDGYQDVYLNNVEVNGQLYNPIPAVLAPSGTTQAIDWDDGQYQILDLENASGDVTLTFSNEKVGAAYLLEVRQDSATPRGLTLPANKVFVDGVAYVPSTGANAVDLLSIVFNGSVFLVTASKNFS